MGTSICAQNSAQSEFSSNPFDYSFGQDNNQTKIVHDDVITSRAKEIEYFLRDCQQKLQKSQRLYKDPSMKSDPVILRSLSSKQSQVKCTFERPYVFLNDPSTGRGKKYKIVDLADCKPSQIIIRDEVLQYFGVFLCFLAQNPHLINEILLTDQNTYGIHVLRMNIGSKKQFIYIDDFILCCDRVPMFSQPIKGIYMWPCLLQKAWFKAKGTTGKKIQKNNPQQVFNAFLSYPMKPYVMRHNDEEYNLRLLHSHIYNIAPQKACIITTKKEPPHKIGLSGNKYFYLLRCFIFGGKRLYYLRNPCEGSLDFRGSHRFVSEELGTYLRELTGELRIAEGNFILEEAEFLEQVQQFFIIHYSKSSQVISEQQISLDDNQQFFITTDIKSDAFVSICFSQQGSNSIERPYSPVIYHVVSLPNQEIVSDQSNEQGCFGVRNTYLLENVGKQMKHGQYLIRIKKKRGNVKKIRKQKVNADRIIVTAPFKVKFDYKQLALMKEKFNSFLKQYGKRQLHSRQSQIRKGKEDIDHKSCWLGDLAIVYIQKIDHSKEEIRIQVSFPELKNLQCISHELKGEFTAMPPFQTNLLIVFEKIDLTEETTLGKYTIQSF